MQPREGERQSGRERERGREGKRERGIGLCLELHRALVILHTEHLKCRSERWRLHRLRATNGLALLGFAGVPRSS